MELQTIDLTAVTANFTTWKTHKDELESATTDLAAIGDKPALPTHVDNVSEDYDSAITARNTWESDKAGYEDAIASRTTLKAEQEALLIAKLPPNTWVRVDLDPEGSHDYYWIGYNTNDAPGYTQYIRLQAGETAPVTPLTHNMDAE